MYVAVGEASRETYVIESGWRKDKVMDELLREQKKNELLQTTENSLEQKCGLCDEYANLELDNGNFICDTCAQIVGEKAEM